MIAEISKDEQAWWKVEYALVELSVHLRDPSPQIQAVIAALEEAKRLHSAHSHTHTLTLPAISIPGSVDILKSTEVGVTRQDDGDRKIVVTLVVGERT